MAPPFELSSQNVSPKGICGDLLRLTKKIKHNPPLQTCLHNLNSKLYRVGACEGLRLRV